MNLPSRLSWVILLVVACTAEPSATPSAIPAPSTSSSPTATPSPTPQPPSPSPSAPVAPTLAPGTTSWRQAFSSGRTLLGNVIAAPGGFFAAGCRTDEEGTCEQSILVRSQDGQAWTVTELAMDLTFWPPTLQLVDGRLFAIAYGHYRDGGGAVVWNSDDGSIWTPIEADSFQDRAVDEIVESPVGTFAVGINAPAESDNTHGFVVWPVNSDGTFGQVRSIEVENGPTILYAATWTGDEFLAWGGQEGPYGGPAIMLASPDGATWKLRGEIPGRDTFVVDVVAVGHRLVAVGHVGRAFPLRPRAWVSDNDGRSWTKATVPSADARMSIVEAVDGSLIARGMAPSEQSTHILSWTSEDGTAWTPLADDVDMPSVPGFRALTRATSEGLVCVAGSLSSETEFQGAIFCR
jgi:hypothetical protein